MELKGKVIDDRAMFEIKYQNALSNYSVVEHYGPLKFYFMWHI